MILLIGAFCIYIIEWSNPELMDFFDALYFAMVTMRSLLPSIFFIPLSDDRQCRSADNVRGPQLRSDMAISHQRTTMAD